MSDDFDSYQELTDMFILSPLSAEKNWTDIVVMSPEDQTVDDYVTLRKCIFEGTCDFIDNSIEIEKDGTVKNGNYLKFTSFAPVAEMVTSKSSIENTLIYAIKNNTVIIEGDFLITKGFPFSIIDLETKCFNNKRNRKNLTYIKSNTNKHSSGYYGNRSIHRNVY